VDSTELHALPTHELIAVYEAIEGGARTAEFIAAERALAGRLRDAPGPVLAGRRYYVWSKSEGWFSRVPARIAVAKEKTRRPDPERTGCNGEILTGTRPKLARIKEENFP
jgi:hypothetical protein